MAISAIALLFVLARRVCAGALSMRLLTQRVEVMMGAVPILFGTFKLLVLIAGMYLAVKSHYDGEKEDKAKAEADARNNRSQALRQTP